MSINSRTVSRYVFRKSMNHRLTSWIIVLPKTCFSVCSRYRVTQQKESHYYILSKRIEQNNFRYLKSPMLFHHSNSQNNYPDKNDTKVVNRKVGTLATMIVDNSGSFLQPYMKLMRIDRPIGRILF